MEFQNDQETSMRLDVGTQRLEGIWEWKELSVQALGEQATAGAFGKTFLVRGVVAKRTDAFVHQNSPDYRPGHRGSHSVYGRLRAERGIPETGFQCSSEMALPQVGEQVVFEGTLRLRYFSKAKRFEARFLVRRVWTREVSAFLLTTIAAMRKRTPSITLEEFVSSKGVKRLALIGSYNGVEDARETARRLGVAHGLTEHRTSMTAWAVMLKTAREAAQTNDALCLVRGGGDPEDFDPWQEPRLVQGLLELGKPIYTALGHSATPRTLTGQWAEMKTSAHPQSQVRSMRWLCGHGSSGGCVGGVGDGRNELRKR